MKALYTIYLEDSNRALPKLRISFTQHFPTLLTILHSRLHSQNISQQHRPFALPGQPSWRGFLKAGILDLRVQQFQAEIPWLSVFLGIPSEGPGVHLRERKLLSRNFTLPGNQGPSLCTWEWRWRGKFWLLRMEMNSFRKQGLGLGKETPCICAGFRFPTKRKFQEIYSQPPHLSYISMSRFWVCKNTTDII